MTRRQTNHLIPSERDKPCSHEHIPFRGDIPCTGPRVCTMCGQMFDGYIHRADALKHPIERHSRNEGIVHIAQDATSAFCGEAVSSRNVDPDQSSCTECLLVYKDWLVWTFAGQRYLDAIRDYGRGEDAQKQYGSQEAYTYGHIRGWPADRVEYIAYLEKELREAGDALTEARDVFEATRRKHTH